MPTNYAGNPANYPLFVAIPAGSDAPTAALFDTAFEGCLDRTAALRMGAQGGIANFWSPVSPGGSGTDNAFYAWDPVGQRWVAAINEGGTTQFVQTFDGRTWSLVHTTAAAGLAINTSQTGFTLVFEGGGSGTVEQISSNGTVTSGTIGIASIGLAALDYFALGFVGTAYQNSLYGIVQTGGTFVGWWYTEVDGTVSSWTGQTGNLPVAFASGTNHVGNILVANTTNNLRQAVAGDVQIWCICGATPGTDTPHMMSVTSTGLTTSPFIVDVTASLPSPGPAYIISGFAYDYQNNLWALLLSTASSGVYLYSSPDHVTWTLVKHFGLYNGTQGGVAIVNGVWCVWLGACAAPSGSNRVVMSPLGSGVWQYAQVVIPVFGTGTPGLPGNLLSNANQLLAGQCSSSSSAIVAAASFWSGFSLGSILP